MSEVLIDTNAYYSAMRGDSAITDLIVRYDRILFSPVVIGELLAGYKGRSHEQRNTVHLRRFLSQPRAAIVEITFQTAQYYALIRSQLKQQGTPIPTNDIWIAASAMEHGAALATSDQHFRHISGLLLAS